MTGMSVWRPYPKGRPPPITGIYCYKWLILFCVISSSQVILSDEYVHFTSSRYNASVPENAHGNTPVISDEKMGIFLSTGSSLNIKYRIIAGDPDNFFKTNSRVYGNFCFLEIVVRTGNRNVLNRESKSSYVLKIKAINKKHGRSRDDIPGVITSVFVDITDLNDISPLFFNNEYSFRLSEDTSLYTSVGKVMAEDPDEGLNGQVYYSFESSTSVFAIHPTSGIITLTKPLSQPDHSKYELKIIAKDRGLQLPGSYPSTASLVFSVTVVNAFEPNIDVTKLTEPIHDGHLMIMALINIQDKDYGSGGEVGSLEISEGDPDKVFRITKGLSSSEFNLAALQILDWDEYPYGFNLSLKASDNGARPRFSRKQIRIVPPFTTQPEKIFLQIQYDIEISEIAPPHTKLVQVSTWTPGIQNRITFSIIAGNEGNQFYIDSSSGVLYTKVNLDAESHFEYSLIIEATSPGIYRLNHQNSAKVFIRVVDSNDFTPIIVAPQGIVTVEEHQNPGSWVAQVRAQDYDSGENKRVSYFLANVDEVPFNIDHFSGEIRTSETLDYETGKRLWKLRVRASDWGKPFSRQSEKIIIVRVLDINDNRPQFEETECSGYLDKTAPIGTEIFTLSALDFDEGNIISYRILDGNEDRCFSLDLTTGVLTLTCDLQDLYSSERVVNVTATDGEHFADTMSIRLQLIHQRSSKKWAGLECKSMGITQKMEEQISLAAQNNPHGEDIHFSLITPSPLPNEHAPQISIPRFEVRLRENSLPGTIVHDVNAHDSDEGYDGYLLYAITDGNVESVFDIGMETGIITVAGYVDRERFARYTLNISVCDLGEHSRQTFQIVTVILIDENDNAPKFDKPAYSFYLPENLATSVYQLSAEDPDEGLNGVISYRLETDTEDFHMNSVSGNLSIVNPLDYETQSIYELKVVATDGGALSSYVYITIELFDINDCSPEFPDKQSSIVRVPEDLPVGALLTIVSATDPDSSNIRYTLYDSHDGTFELDSNTAVLRLKKSLDFEFKSSYNLSVGATDDRIPPLSSNTYVIIQVVDVDENVHAPVFGQDVLEAKVSEGAQPDTFVASAMARDGDLNLNPADAYISYSIVGSEGIGHFYIDQKGDIYTSTWLDRETKSHYWIAVRATDSGTVPRHSTLHVYIEVEDINDNRPLSSWPIYWPAISEDSPPDTRVVTIEAEDPDLAASNGDHRVVYRITSGNDLDFFKIDSYSGEIRTTKQRLDREVNSEHLLEISISDEEGLSSYSSIALSSTTYVVVSVSDENDNAPEFLERIYKFTVPFYGNSVRSNRGQTVSENVETVSVGQKMQSLLAHEELIPITTEGAEVDFHSSDEEVESEGSGSLHEKPHSRVPLNQSFERTQWEAERDKREVEFLTNDFFLEPVARVIAKDLDDNENGDVSYRLEGDEWFDAFKIHMKSGVIYAKQELSPEQQYKFKVEAFDNGRPQNRSYCWVIITPKVVPSQSANAPIFLKGEMMSTSVLESDVVGQLVYFIEASDLDGDLLWFSIEDGNENDAFAIGSENGNLLIAKPLDAETISSYKLSVSVTDGVHVTMAQIIITIIDVNDNRPVFSSPSYEFEISENASPSATVFALSATDRDSDQVLAYTLQNTAHVASKNKFNVDPVSGNIILMEPLDREVQDTHILTVGVKDRINPVKQNFARVTIRVRDYNDHAPRFVSSSYNGTVLESAAVGSRVLRLFALDKDKGPNGHVMYSIVSGNLGGIFRMDPESGELLLARPVDQHKVQDMWLSVKASDEGSPPKHSLVNVHIAIEREPDAPPRFYKNDYLFEISEWERVGSYIGSLATHSHLRVVYSMMPDHDRTPFVVNPATGVLSLNKPLNYEETHSYNLTVIATSLNGRESTANVMISVKDENDNAPRFFRMKYVGHISEAALINSVVLTDGNLPLVVSADDRDSEQNANLFYSIMEEDARRYFAIDSSTGAIKNVSPLDHEVLPMINFSVTVHDSGNPRLNSPAAASVSVTITDINDVPPRFLSPEFNSTVFVPTHSGVSVLKMEATDLDFDGKANLVYSIVAGNKERKFKVDPASGLISVNDSSNLREFYKLKATVSDGQFESSASVNIYVESLPKSGLRFAREKYFASVVENSTKIENIVMVNVLGSDLGEHMSFRILNPTELFHIKESSGIIHTTGKVFDREEEDNYALVIEAMSSRKTFPRRVAHVIVHVVVSDINDNAPIFVNTPYYGVIPVDSVAGSLAFTVHATDFDSDRNSQVRYELQKGNGEVFSVKRLSGEIRLKQTLTGIARDHELIIMAYDGGSPPLSSQVTVRLKIVDRSQPIFDQQFYTAMVVESADISTPIITMSARSQLNRQLIYTISGGNEEEHFYLEHDLGILSVNDELDYETQKSYQLQIRAIDKHTGKYAEVTLSIQIIDTNDNPPAFSKNFYNVSVSEAAVVASPILQVASTDADKGTNAGVSYQIKDLNGSLPEHFYMEGSSGMLILKKALDKEAKSFHHFMVIATDMGSLPLSSTAQIYVNVMDMNDNPPYFSQPSFQCRISEGAFRGQFVSHVTAFDEDEINRRNLIYSIVDGNQLHAFAVDATTGIVSVWNHQRLRERLNHALNISVTDGVFTAYARLEITVTPINAHSPVFTLSQYEVMLKENSPVDTYVTTVKADDVDLGRYGDVTYHLLGSEAMALFNLNENTGEIRTLSTFDREKRDGYVFYLMAMDIGGRTSFTKLQIQIEDENDNAPVFSRGSYECLLKSNVSSGALVAVVSAEDEDFGLNGKLKYQFPLSTPDAIKSTFSIAEDTGEIRLVKPANNIESRVVEFFVETFDMSENPLFSRVPLVVRILDHDTRVPEFVSSVYSFTLNENSTPGTMIGSVIARYDGPLEYSVEWGQRVSPPIAINSKGKLTVRALIDYERQSKFLIQVSAFPRNQPDLTAVTIVTIDVLDINDEVPRFESEKYYISVAENMPVGSNIMKVTAHDADSRRGSELRYLLEEVQPLEEEPLFTLDPYSGWLSLNHQLDAEKKAKYELKTIVTDIGNSSLSSSAVILLQVIDYNDNPPRFSREKYKSSVSEDALPGTVVITLAVDDFDLTPNRHLNFYLTSGNEDQTFQIKSGGQIYVTRQLDREKYQQFSLTVTLTDGSFVSIATVEIEVLDVDDNAPICTQPKYRHHVSEDASIGTHLLSVSAHDPDLVSPPMYFLSGDGSESFSLDRNTGRITIREVLDREKRSHYDLKVTVRDGANPDWQCFCFVSVEVGDVNDNAPVFSQHSYSLNVPENSPDNLILIKIYATDPDLGLNRKITYSLDGSDKFVIDRKTGLLSATTSLDRETRAMYNLTVTAVDHGSIRMSSSAYILVLVADMNDNPPEFASRVYYTTIAENTNVGTDIVRLLATSMDSGENAKITYSIIGGNEHRKFTIHQEKGTVSILEPLDFERGNNYMLTIQARDGGDPPLSNHATVNVTVTDVNDNLPIFIQNSYSAVVNEAAPNGERLIKVVATDQDSGENGKLTYAISGGDPHNQFQVDKHLGWISVARPLDRESISSYTLDVIAVDRGIPQRTGSVSVYIEVMDANDNPPVFTVVNNTAYVQEDKPVNHLVFEYEVMDSDSDKERNGAPFTFEIRKGNSDGSFRITPDGELRTATTFDHRVRDLYRLQIRVYDNGRMPLFSDTWINVKIIEESQFPPEVFPLTVMGFIPSDSYFGGELGCLQASDEDPYDTLIYSIVPDIKNPGAEYFTVDKQSGIVSSKSDVDEGTYKLNVSVSDGKFTAFGSVSVDFIEITDEMLDGSSLIRLRGASPQEFLLSYRKNFHKGIKSIMKVKPRDVIIISIQNQDQRVRREKSSLLFPSYKEGIIEILFAVKRPNGGYIPRNFIRRKVLGNRKSLEGILGLTVLDVPKNKCRDFKCTNGHCKEVISLAEQSVKVSTEFMSFVSPLHEHDAVCICPPGYSGRTCDTIINQCAYTPCPSYQVCIPQQTKLGYVCECKEGLTGATCAMNKSECIGRESNPECYSPVSPLAFKGKSFIQYLLQHPIERHLTYSVWLRTFHPSGNLMFSAGRLDYSILEIAEGQVRFRWDLGSGEGIVVVPSRRVDDGLWHYVMVERMGSSVFLSVDRKWESEGSSPGSNEILNLESQHFYLGAEVHPWSGSGKDPRHGFVGCMDNPRLENSPVPLAHSPSNSVAALVRLAFVTNHCFDQLRAPGLCGSHPCLNGGTCEERKNSYVCECHSRFAGPRCELDSNPCASSPCLNNGHCVNEGNHYRCDCPAQVSGSRCQYIFCNPNPCLNHGLCEEGISGPICKCQGFTGAYCNVDINECEKSPCEERGTCINTYGGFKCMCHSNFSGSYCDIPSAISAFPIDIEEIVYIVIGVLGVVIVILFIILMMHCREKQVSRRRRRREQNHFILNSKAIDNHHHNMCKRNSKMSNIEASQSCTSRPESFPHSPVNETSFVHLNNFDTVRSYGSAGDELENLPQFSKDFVQNIAKANTLNNYNRNSSLSNSSIGMSRASSGIVPHNAYCPPDVPESIHKPWKDARNHKEAYYEAGKIQNDVKVKSGEYINLKKLRGGGKEGIRRSYPPRDDMSVLSGASGEEMQEYHWDCSDWARPSETPLPNIVEVSVGEVRDSSSYHSNESNESVVDKSMDKGALLPPAIDPVRDMETLAADELGSECGTDFDLNSSRRDFDTSTIFDLCSDPGAESDTSMFTPHPQRYESHPNRYLPRYHANSETETEDERGRLLSDSITSPYRKASNFLPSSSPNQLINQTSPHKKLPKLGTATQAPIPPEPAYSPPAPKLRTGNNRRFANAVKRISFPTSPDDEAEGISLFAVPFDTSASDVENVCDIDDSEVNSEFENDK